MGGRRNGPMGLTEHLVALRMPTLILQGERENFGTREEVGSWARLLANLHLDGFDHRLRLRLHPNKTHLHLTSIGCQFRGFSSDHRSHTPP